jgi:hypothetical protein
MAGRGFHREAAACAISALISIQDEGATGDWGSARGCRRLGGPLLEQREKGRTPHSLFIRCSECVLRIKSVDYTPR